MDFHVSLFHLLGLKLKPEKVQSVPFLEQLHKFHLDIFIPRYSNYPQVSYLGMNSGRGQNPKLEGSYHPEYSESESCVWRQCSSGVYLRRLQFLASETSPISEYSDCTKTQQFQYLGFLQLRVKLGFDFPGVLPNQIS